MGSPLCMVKRVETSNDLIIITWSEFGSSVSRTLSIIDAAIFSLLILFPAAFSRLEFVDGRRLWLSWRWFTMRLAVIALTATRKDNRSDGNRMAERRQTDAEMERLAADDRREKNWKRWGPYLARSVRHRIEVELQRLLSGAGSSVIHGSTSRESSRFGVPGSVCGSGVEAARDQPTQGSEHDCR